jgi:hypothetical protein
LCAIGQVCGLFAYPQTQVVEYVGILLGGWVALRTPCLVLCSASTWLLSLFCLGTIAIFDTGSVAGAWIMTNLGLGWCGFALGEKGIVDTAG